MSVVGLDIGNENSYIAVVKSGGIEILDNEYSLRSTPTYVAFTENSRDIGVSAKAKLITNVENTIFGFKRILGKKYFDSESEFSYFPYEVCELPSGDIGFKVNYLKNSVLFSVEQLMAMMLTKLKGIAEVKLGNKIRDCVIAVPVHYTDIQRRAMLDATVIAGLNALKLVNESTAVALSYGYFKQDFPEHECRNVLFIDIGNSSTTVTACAFSKDKFKILGCVWDDVGGRDFDNVLVQHFVNYLNCRYDLNAMSNKRALLSLMNECESLKKMMSVNPLEIGFQIECFMQEQDVRGKLKRENFEKLSEQVFDRIKRTFCRILSDSQLNPQAIHSVELVGGSSRIPEVKRLIREVFLQDPNSTLNQDEAVARGCALQCALLSPSLKTRDFVIEDIPSYSIKIAWKNMEYKDEELEVFSRSDKIPSFKMITLLMAKPFTLTAFNVDSNSKLYKIGNFTFGNMPENAEKYSFIKLKVKACLDINSLFSLISAKVFIKNCESDKEKILSDKDLKDESMDLSTVPNTENIVSDTEDTSTNSNSVKYQDLTIISDVPGLSKTKLNEYTEAEKQMIHKDTAEKERADACNALEEYIYDVRGRISYELKDFLLDEDRKQFLQQLNETQEWLYENETQDATEYSKRLRVYQNLFDPVYKRYMEWEERPAVIESYNNTLQQSLNVIRNLENYPDTFADEIGNLRNIWQNSKQYLDQAISSFSQLKKSEDVPLTTYDMKMSLKNFTNEFQNAVSKLEKKINAAKESPHSSSGDSNSQEPKTSEDNGSNLQEETKKEQSTHRE